MTSTSVRFWAQEIVACVSAGLFLIDPSASPFLINVPSPMFKMSSSFVLLEHATPHNARNAVAGNLHHQLLRHFTILEMGSNNLADLGTFSINRVIRADEVASSPCDVEFRLCGQTAFSRSKSALLFWPRLRLNLLSPCPDSREEIHNFPREAVRPRRSREGLSWHHSQILRPLFAGHANKRHAPRSIQ